MTIARPALVRLSPTNTRRFSLNGTVGPFVQISTGGGKPGNLVAANRNLGESWVPNTTPLPSPPTPGIHSIYPRSGNAGGDKPFTPSVQIVHLAGLMHSRNLWYKDESLPLLIESPRLPTSTRQGNAAEQEHRSLTCTFNGFSQEPTGFLAAWTGRIARPVSRIPFHGGDEKRPSCPSFPVDAPTCHRRLS